MQVIIRTRRNRFTGTWAARGKYGEISGLPTRREAIMQYLEFWLRVQKRKKELS